MNKLIKFLSRAKAWLRTEGEVSVLETVLSNNRRNIITDSNDAFFRAVKITHEKAGILKSRREKLLCRLIMREIDRTAVSRCLTKKESTKRPIFGIAQVFESYLNRGFLYFSDFGLSPDSLFRFLELGEITKQMYKELKAVPDKLDHALFEGDDRKEEYQREVYDGLMNPIFETYWRRFA